MNKRREVKNSFIFGVFAILCSTLIFAETAQVYADSTLITVNISDTSLELDVPASPTVLTLNPTATGANFGYVDLTATVGTNNPTGYQLSVTFSDTSLIRTAAVDGSTPTIDTLDTLAGGYPVADFTVNRWGHKITGDNYFPVPSTTLSPESWASDEPVNNWPNVITLAAKADGTIPSGIYETTLTYTLVANYVEPDPDTTTFDEAYAAAGKTKDSATGKYKMQDMTANICSAVTTPIQADNSDTQETQLVDTRDNKLYWVAKLKDGKCWMTQNLDFDIPTTVLTSDTTDLTEYGTGGYTSDDGYSNDNGIISWTPQRATVPASSISSSGSISGWSNNYNNPYSVDTGNWYWTDTWYSSTTNNYLNIDDSGAGDKFSQTPYSGNGLHGHVGNYYNWSAAIASNNTSNYTSSTYSTPENNPGNSICPAGWKLPVIASYTSGQLGNNDFYNLVYTQGGNNWNSDQNITAALLWFVRGGYVNSSSLYNSGSYGAYWSSTVYDSDYASYLYFRSGYVDTYYDYDRSRGRSVRCIAR